MLDAALALANSKGGASFLAEAGKGLFAPDNSPVLSGQVQFDSRGFLDGSGWTVATGSADARGATMTRSGDPFGAPSFPSASGVSQAGAGWLFALVMVGLAAAVVLKGRL